jgi:hypothetical protein
MSRLDVQKNIFLQAKNLINAIPRDSMVYIHWKNGNPVVLPQKERGYGMITSVRLESILRKQFSLVI